MHPSSTSSESFSLELGWSLNLGSHCSPFSLFISNFLSLVFWHMESQWCTAVFTKLLWVGLKRLETSLSLLGSHSHKCLQGCLCWSLFCSSLGKRKTSWILQPFEMLFCDRSTDQFSKPRGTNPCSYAPGKIRVFEADGICVLCRKTVKLVDLSWASISPQALKWRRLLILWTLCQFFSLRDRQSDCFPSCLLSQSSI